MKIDVWSDVICPWCWLGRARLAKAVAASPRSPEIEIVFRSFELDPGSPKDLDIPTNEMLEKKFNMDKAQIDAMHRRISAMGREEGIDYQFDKARTSNTFDAHRLVHLAAEQGRRTEMVDRLFEANFHDGIRVGDRKNLIALADELGVSGAAEALESQRFADAVRADEAEAKQRGVSGVPFFLLDGKRAVAGAQSVDVLVRALT
ncbi:MAG: DsbA family oxidoreductase [Labilithrix sp.]